MPDAPGHASGTSSQRTGKRATVKPMGGGHMGNPNPLKQPYTCYTCGEPRPPYQFYCDRHLDAGEKAEKVPLLDRLMRRIVGR